MHSFELLLGFSFMPEIFVFLIWKEIACAPAFYGLLGEGTLGSREALRCGGWEQKCCLEPTFSQASTGCTKGPQKLFFLLLFFPQRITRIRMYLQSDLGWRIRKFLLSTPSFPLSNEMPDTFFSKPTKLASDVECSSSLRATASPCWAHSHSGVSLLASRCSSGCPLSLSLWVQHPLPLQEVDFLIQDQADPKRFGCTYLSWNAGAWFFISREAEYSGTPLFLWTNS